MNKNHKNDSSQMKDLLIDFTTDCSSETNSKKDDSKGGGSNGGKELDQEVAALDVAGLNVGEQKASGPTKAGQGGKVEGSKEANSDTMGAKESKRPAGSNPPASNAPASPETSSNGASSTQTSGKRKLSQTSCEEAWGVGSSRDPGEKLKREPECHMALDKLQPSPNHTVLIDTNEFQRTSDRGFCPYVGTHMWGNQHVKLPLNYPKNGPVSRWEATEKALSELTKGKPSMRDIERAIMSYNHTYKKEWRFDGLNHYVQQLNRHEDISTLISKMAKLATQLPNYIKHAIPLLKQNHSHAITLSQVQISCLLANAFFCTFPHRNTTKPNSEYSNYPTINFSSLFGEPSQRKIQKLRALFSYFNTVTDEGTKPNGLVTFERIYVAPDKLPNWKKQNEMLTNFHAFAEGSIEKEGKGMLQVDFAAKLIGGGVLNKGLVQEEIRFLMCPELIVSRLFTEKLGDNECLKITGAQTYSCSSGYSDSFKWLGPYTDETGRDEWKRRFCQIVAIDAMNFKNPWEQYTKENVKRELNKAYVGFRRDPETPLEYTPDIATGNWGCGAFKGDPELKALIQMMAASVAGRNLAFFTFGNRGQANELQQIHDFLKTNRVSVGRLYSLLIHYCEENQHGRPKSVFDYIRKQIGSTTSLL